MSENYSNVSKLSEEDRQKLFQVVEDCANSKMRMAAERTLVNTKVKDICKDLSLEPSLVKKIIDVYYKQNFDDEVFLQEEFKKLYQKIVP